MSKQVQDTLQEMLGILKEGRMTEGQETYFADAVVTQEGNQPPIVGKKASSKDWTNSERRSEWRLLSAMQSVLWPSRETAVSMTRY